MNWLLQLWYTLIGMPKPIVTINLEPVNPLPIAEPLPEVKPKPMPTQRERMYECAKSYLGQDIAKTQNELGCAEAISFLLNKIEQPNFPVKGFLSTTDLYKWLQKNSVLVSEGLPGRIIISPTGSSTKGAAHGHVGIVAYHGILSNNSMTGLFSEYYNLSSWTHYYRDKLGFPIYFFEL